MEENKLPQPRRVIGVPQKREEITSILAECYSRDLFELDEYEHRLDLVHAASTLDDLELLIKDVPADILDDLQKNIASPSRAREGKQLTVDHGVRKLDDQRLAVKQLNVKSTGGVIKLKYNEVAQLPEEIIINADLTGSVLKITVPPEFIVSEEMENSMSVIKYRRGRKYSRVPVKGKILITGSAVRSVVKIRTRRSKLR
jgi:hypothetical protein